ncbi:thioredoxin [Clostridiales bacterium PH28_bin88]|nr:thioredoxin [Clostridiales bacterium PH28_bin88]
MASGNLFTLTDANFDAEVLQSGKPVLVDFWAVWCGPCKMIAPLVEELAEEYAGKVKIGKLNVDESGETPGRYGIMSIPTLLLFKNGEVVNRLVGYQPKEHLVRMINGALQE